MVDAKGNMWKAPARALLRYQLHLNSDSSRTASLNLNSAFPPRLSSLLNNWITALLTIDSTSIYVKSIKYFVLFLSYSVAELVLGSTLWSYRNISAVKSVFCSCRRAEFSYQTIHLTAHNYIQLKLQRIWCPFLVYTDTGTCM